jgi:hypothetical protein
MKNPVCFPFCCRKKRLRPFRAANPHGMHAALKACFRKLMSEKNSRSAKTILVNLMIYKGEAAVLFVQNSKWGNVHIMSLCIS